LTYIEALSSGCPVVCKYDPCIDGVIEQGNNGYSYKEKGEFTSYINQILTDTILRDKMSMKAVSKTNEYSSSVFANKVLDNYWSMIHASKEATIPLVEFMNPKVQKR
jgi:1,2-diacylglycerol 3-alpha-glucosyltransferase